MAPPTSRIRRLNPEPDLREVFLEVRDLDEPERSRVLEVRTRNHPDIRVEIQRMLHIRAGNEPCPPHPKPIAAPSALPEFIGKYRVLRRLGRGGMGEVYEVEDPVLARSIAIKLLRPADGAENRGRALIEEARTLARLNHPHIASIHDYEDDPVQLIRMEKVDGEGLDRVLKRQEPLGLDRSVKYAGQIADALEAAHQRGVIHRDLKPSNIMIGSRDQIVILDFGIAKLTDGAEDTEPSSRLAAASVAVSSRLGTLHYMSPEQLSATGITTQSDMWAFGAVLFEMLTNRRYVQDANPLALPTPPSLRELPSGTSSQLWKLLCDCLSVEPKDRPTATEAKGILDRELVVLQARRLETVGRGGHR